MQLIPKTEGVKHQYYGYDMKGVKWDVTDNGSIQFDELCKNEPSLKGTAMPQFMANWDAAPIINIATGELDLERMKIASSWHDLEKMIEER